MCTYHNVLNCTLFRSFMLTTPDRNEIHNLTLSLAWIVLRVYRPEHLMHGPHCLSRPLLQMFRIPMMPCVLGVHDNEIMSSITIEGPSSGCELSLIAPLPPSIYCTISLRPDTTHCQSRYVFDFLVTRFTHFSLYNSSLNCLNSCSQSLPVTLKCYYS